MDVRQLVGQNVRKLRLDRDMSQEAVAELMGVDRAYVSALELGHRNPTIITLWQVAEALDVDLRELVEPVSAPRPSGRAPRQRSSKSR
jgi:transcriptional regulator with XRE-family HTH domain